MARLQRSVRALRGLHLNVMQAGQADTGEAMILKTENPVEQHKVRSRVPLLRSRPPSWASETASENKKSGLLRGRFFVDSLLIC